MNKAAELTDTQVREAKKSLPSQAKSEALSAPEALMKHKGDNAAIHDALEDVPSNPTDNRPFAEVMEATISRRSVMQGSVAVAVGAFLAPKELLAGADTGGEFKVTRRWNRSLCDFAPVTIAQYTAESDGAKIPVISDDYEYHVLIPWGTPIVAGVPEYTGDPDPDKRPTPEQQEWQIGIGHDGMWLFPDEVESGKGKRKKTALSNDAGMLCINHEFGRNTHVLGKGFPTTLTDVRLSQAAHGCSVVRVAKDSSGKWDVEFDDRNRRITVNTPVVFDGPVAGSEFLENPAGNPTLGTVNNCGNGFTPWGTYLTCEENFNGYFGSTAVQALFPQVLAEVTEEVDNEVPPIPPEDRDDEIADRVDDRLQEIFNETATESQKRYGFSYAGFGYGWDQFDDRFDLSKPDYVNEGNRFGYIVEIDPQNPDQPPIKHTALGRFKHEAIAIAEIGGRVVCYMGDDQRFDYCYKFVSAEKWTKAIRNGRNPLAKGTLYVARFDDDGTGEWLELSRKNPALKREFDSMAELLVNARIAADIVGATPMDRPEWTTIAQDGKSVFWTLTNNSRRTAPNAANPEAPNEDGHIIKTRDRGRSNRFDWDFFILASDTRGTEGVFTDPDAAYADRDGRLFIGTDGGQPEETGLQDQLTVFDTTKRLAPGENPKPKRLFVGVNSDEITGWAQTPDQKTAMINMQHPGDGDPTRTNFPAPTDGKTIPRDCTIVITKKDGGVVGS
jgi:secreted PhoX family phosphatase